MNITIYLKAYFEWMPAQTGDISDDPEIREAAEKAMKIKPAVGGGWLIKTVVEEETHTTIGVPEALIEERLTHFADKGIKKSRASVVGWILEELTMPHHGHPTHFSKICVEGEPDTERFLNSYFEVSP